MNIAAIIFLAIALVQLTGHFFPPFSILALPLLMVAIVGLSGRFFRNKFKFSTVVILILLILNDFIIRKFAGGIHDQVGKAICNIFFCVSFSFTVIGVMIGYIANYHIWPKPEKLTNISFLSMASALVWILFWYGLSCI